MRLLNKIKMGVGALALLCLNATPSLAQSYPSPTYSRITVTGQGSTGDASKLSVIPGSSATVSRTLDTHLSDRINTLNYTSCNGVADDTSGLVTAVTAASSSGKLLVISGQCRTTATINVPSNLVIEGSGNSSITAIGTSGRIFALNGVSNVTIKSLTLYPNYPNTSINYTIQVDNSSKITLRDLSISKSGSSGIAVTGSSSRVVIDNATIMNSNQHAMQITDSSDVIVSNSRFDGQLGSGVLINGVSTRVKILNNTSYQSGIEMIGATYSTSDLIISNNQAYNTGDNCYSLTGHHITFTGNIGVGCAGSGLNIYGHHVTATGNYFRNNAQGHATNAAWSSGIQIGGGLGGTGQHNTVVANVITDNQVTPTEQYGVHIYPFNTTLWTSGITVSAGAYVYYGLNIYKATAAGVTGTMPPTCTSSTCSDGNISWIYADSFDTTIQPDYNIVQNNQISNQAIASVKDDSSATNNIIATPITSIPTNLNATSVALTTTGYTVNSNINLLRLTHSTTLASSTINLPNGVIDGQQLRIVNYTAPVTALAFNPSVNGWTNGWPFNTGGMLLIWDSDLSKWVRVQ